MTPLQLLLSLSCTTGARLGYFSDNYVNLEGSDDGYDYLTFLSDLPTTLDADFAEGWSLEPSPAYLGFQRVVYEDSNFGYDPDNSHPPTNDKHALFCAATLDGRFEPGKFVGISGWSDPQWASTGCTPVFLWFEGL